MQEEDINFWKHKAQHQQPGINLIASDKIYKNNYNQLGVEKVI